MYETANERYVKWFCNASYSTGFGYKDIARPRGTVRLHDTNNFGVLAGAFIHRLDGRQPRDSTEEDYFRYFDSYTDGRQVLNYLNRFRVDNPLFTELQIITQAKDKEYDIRHQIGQRAFGLANADEFQTFRRELAYSSSIDHIGDDYYRRTGKTDLSIFCA